MKLLKLIILSASIFVSTSSFAQFEDFLRGGTADANVFFNHYMTPFMKGVGYGFNNGWYNTAKPHETLGFDLTFSFNAAMVPVADQSFQFTPSEYNNTRLLSGSPSLPTLLGGNSTSVLENYINTDDVPPQNPPLPPNQDIPIGSYQAPDGVGDDLEDIFNQRFVPSPIIQAGIGIIKGTELKIRWMPTVNTEDIKFKYFGVGGLHSISQWIPVLKERKFLDISAFVGWTTISAEYAIPDGSIDGANQVASFDVNTFTYQLIASAHVSVITGYIGIGMDNFSTTFKMLGTYDVYPSSPIPVPVLENPITLDQSGTGGFRTTFGARLKLAIITIHADYTIREYNTLTAGLGFSFR